MMRSWPGPGLGLRGSQGSRPAQGAHGSVPQAHRSAEAVIGLERGFADVLPGASPAAGLGGGVEGLPELHLLVVDDDDAVREACLEIARKMGFATVGAHDVPSAQAILKHQKLDLVLLDFEAAGQHGRRAGPAGERQGAESGNAGDRDDGVCHGFKRGGGDADWRGRLPDQAVCAGRAGDGAGARGRAAALRP